jgi:hypothetical protein
MFEATGVRAPLGEWNQSEWNQGEGEWNQGEGEWNQGEGEWNQGEGGWNQGEGEWNRRRYWRRRRYSNDDEYGTGSQGQGEGEEQFLPIIAGALKLLPTIISGISSLTGGNRRESEFEEGEDESEEHFLLGNILKQFLGETQNEGELPLHPAQESELAGRLLQVSGEDELRQVLGRIVDTIGSTQQGIRNAAGTPQGQALIEAAAPIARTVVPGAGMQPEQLFETGQAGAIGHEQQAYEAARQAVRLTADAARNVATAPPGAPPEIVGELGLIRAASRFAPGVFRAARRAFSVSRRAFGYRRPYGYGGGYHYNRPYAYRGGYRYGRPYGYRSYYGGHRGPLASYRHPSYRYPYRFPYQARYGYPLQVPAAEPPPDPSMPPPPPMPPMPPVPEPPPQPGFRWVAVPIGAPDPVGPPPGPAGPPPEPPGPEPMPAGVPAGQAGQGEWYGGDREWGQQEWRPGQQNGWHRNQWSQGEWPQQEWGQNEWTQGEWG